MTNHVPEATKPASGDYAWLGAEAGSVADLMYMLNTEDWYDAINSRFVSELLDDTLPESILKAYLIQDFKFYNNGMMARLIKLAPRQETKDMLAAQSQWFADNEATYFEHFLEAYHVSQEEYDATEPTPANKEYGAYLDSLSDGSFEKIVNNRCYDSLVSILFDVHQSFVGVGHLFQVWSLFGYERERCILVEVFIQFLKLFSCRICSRTLFTFESDKLSTEYTSCKVASVWYEVDVAFQFSLKFCNRLTNLVQMLMVHHLVSAHIVSSPAEVGSASRLLSCAG